MEIQRAENRKQIVYELDLYYHEIAQAGMCVI